MKLLKGMLLILYFLVVQLVAYRLAETLSKYKSIFPVLNLYNDTVSALIIHVICGVFAIIVVTYSANSIFKIKKELELDN